VPLVDDEGKPLDDKDGKPLVKDGKPIVKRLASCDKDAKGAKRTGSDRDNCRFLFMRVSDCRILPDDLDKCIDNDTKECPADNGADCIKDKTEGCRKRKTEQCEHAKVKGWVEEFDDDAHYP